jgi:hypothetical protein
MLKLPFAAMLSVIEDEGYETNPPLVNARPVCPDQKFDDCNYCVVNASEKKPLIA